MASVKKISLLSVSGGISGQHLIISATHSGRASRSGLLFVFVGEFFMLAVAITVDNFTINGIATGTG